VKANLQTKIDNLEFSDKSISLGNGGAGVLSHPPQGLFLWTQVRKNIRFSDMGDAINRQKVVLRKEIEFLDTLINEMATNLDEMRYVQTASMNAQTFTGKLRSWMDFFFSMILLSQLGAALSKVGKHYFMGRTI
jgi:hypothetical protein